MTNEALADLFNGVLKQQLTAINQYFLHARILKKLGRFYIADHAYKASISAMRHADLLIEYMLCEGYTPQINTLGTLRIGSTLENILCHDIQLANASVLQMSNAVGYCSCQEASKLLHTIITATEEYMLLLEAELSGGQSLFNQELKA
jgi:bacterioferritin